MGLGVGVGVGVRVRVRVRRGVAHGAQAVAHGVLDLLEHVLVRALDQHLSRVGVRVRVRVRGWG